jgi:hypothetical protein
VATGVSAWIVSHRSVPDPLFGNPAGLAADRTAGAQLAFAAAALAEAATAMALAGVRQWRFAPRVRVWHAAGAVAVSGIVLGLYLPLALHGVGWAIAVLAACAACSVLIGRRPSGLSDESAGRFRRRTAGRRRGAPADRGSQRVAR